MNDTIARWLESSSAFVMNLRHYSKPDAEVTSRPPGLVAHRGAWDTHTTENTMAAFKRAQALGSWAIEFDVRFTRDNQPVIHHDADLKRFFGRPDKLADLTWRELSDAGSHVPRLQDVLALKGLHFMIEVKTNLTTEQQEILESHLRAYKPIQDYHLLSLHPDLVRLSPSLPPRAWVMVGDMNVPFLARAAADQGLGGVAAHYLFVTDYWVRWLRERGIKAGAGFVPTQNLYYREWSRGLDWVFTNTLANLKNVSI